MKPFSSILVPLDGSAAAARGLSAAAWLAARLQARLHILSATERERPAREELERLKIDAKHWPNVTLHQVSELPERAVLDAVEQMAADLIVMSAHGEAADTGVGAGPLQPLGHVTRCVVEQSSVPVLVLPPSYRERLPWTRALVPISGEVEADAALALAVELANALGLKIKIAHVLGAGDESAGLMAEVRYADSVHHEYPSRLQQLISRLLPQCSPSECECIEDVTLLRGDVTDELLKLLEQERTGLLVAGWHGRFIEGHAELIKRLLREIMVPILMIKAAPAEPFALKVGEALE